MPGSSSNALNYAPTVGRRNALSHGIDQPEATWRYEAKVQKEGERGKGKKGEGEKGEKEKNGGTASRKRASSQGGHGNEARPRRVRGVADGSCDFPISRLPLSVFLPFRVVSVGDPLRGLPVLMRNPGRSRPSARFYDVGGQTAKENRVGCHVSGVRTASTAIPLWNGLAMGSSRDNPRQFPSP
jgi:hypothetical protein